MDWKTGFRIESNSLHSNSDSGLAGLNVPDVSTHTAPPRSAGKSLLPIFVALGLVAHRKDGIPDATLKMVIEKFAENRGKVPESLKH